MGEVGLLEIMEAFHNYVKDLPVFKANSNFRGNKSGCVAKLEKILLIHIYGEMIDPLPLKEKRKSYRHHNSGCMTATTKASHIKVIHEYDGRGCICGRAPSCALCQYCSYGKVEELEDFLNVQI